MPTSRKKSGRVIGLESGYWGPADAQEVLDLWRQSGTTLSAFAREHGLCRNRLARWRDRLDERADSSELKFHRVRVVGSPTRQETGPGCIEIVLAGGRRVVVRQGFDDSSLAAVIRVLESLSC